MERRMTHHRQIRFLPVAMIAAWIAASLLSYAALTAKDRENKSPGACNDWIASTDQGNLVFSFIPIAGELIGALGSGFYHHGFKWEFCRA